MTTGPVRRGTGCLTWGEYRAILDLVKPSVPDTPVLRDIRTRSDADFEAEAAVALAFKRAADTYLSWVNLSRQLRDDLGAVDAVVRGEQNGDLPLIEEAKRLGESPINGRPSLRQAIRVVMHRAGPDHIWKKAELMEELKKHGWEPRGGKPGAQLATRLAEAIERGEITRESVGHYKLAGSAYVQAALGED